MAGRAKSSVGWSRARNVILLGALFSVVCVLTLGSGAGAAVAAKKKPKSTSTTAKATAAALTVDACKLLTDAEVEAYVNSIGGNYKAQLPFEKQPAPATVRNPAPDPAKQRFCTWGFDQATGDGSTSDDGHVALTVERLAANVANPCSLVASSGVRNLTGIGDQAQTTNSGVVGCVVVGTVKMSIAFDGAEENGTPGDGVIDNTLKQLATRVGRG